MGYFIIIDDDTMPLPATTTTLALRKRERIGIACVRIVVAYDGVSFLFLIKRTQLRIIIVSHIDGCSVDAIGWISGFMFVRGVRELLDRKELFLAGKSE